jgi:hypothetical protein
VDEQRPRAVAVALALEAAAASAAAAANDEKEDAATTPPSSPGSGTVGEDEPSPSSTDATATANATANALLSSPPIVAVSRSRPAPRAPCLACAALPGVAAERDRAVKNVDQARSISFHTGPHTTPFAW